MQSELLLESYVNALVAYDAICNAIRPYIGPVGPRGKSNYELAVEAGYEGTLEEWINEQKGVKGDPGTPAGFGTIDAEIDDTGGEPAVDVSTGGTNEEKNIHFSFSGLKGTSIKSITQTTESLEPEGNNIIKITLEDDREFTFKVKNGPAGIQDASATVDWLPGTPRCVASIEDGILTLSFYGLKGMQGEPGTNNTTMSIVDELPSEENASTSIVYLLYNDETEKYDQYIIQVDGSTRTWVQAGSLEINSDDFQRKDDEVWLTQEAFDAIAIKDITKTYNVYEEDDSIAVGEVDDDTEPEEESEEEPEEL